MTEAAVSVEVGDNQVATIELRRPPNNFFSLDLIGGIAAPLAVQAIRQTLRGDLADQVQAATDHELIEQDRMRATTDFVEGNKAMAERRPPVFRGQ